MITTSAQQRGYDMGGLRGRHDAAREVPAPYYGGAEGFERVLDMMEDTLQGLLQYVRKRYSNTPSSG